MRASLSWLIILALSLTGCQTMKTLFRGKAKPEDPAADYRLVAVDNTPFFASLDSRDGSDAKPSRFLKKGAKVKLLEEDKRTKFSKVEMANQNVGWIPSRLVMEKAPKPPPKQDKRDKDKAPEPKKTDETKPPANGASPEPAAPTPATETPPPSPAPEKVAPPTLDPNAELPTPIVPDPGILSPSEE